MKKTGICPKCNCHDLICIPEAEAIPGVWIAQARPTMYICSECGYSETWVDNKEELLKLKKTFGIGRPAMSLSELLSD